jgi:hypothetical protein
MSQPELERTLRTIRPVAPPELRERVRMLAAQPLPARGLDRWRRLLALAIPLAAALAAALVAVLARDHGSRPESSTAAKSSPLEASRAAAPRVADQAGAAAPEQAVVALARSLDGTVVSRRLLAHAVELRLRFPRGQARGAVRRLVALPGTVRVDLTPHNARDADTVVVRVSRP